MIEESVKALRELGICLYDRHGQMKPLQELIEELKGVYYKVNPESKPLLTIELQDETSVPRVFYKGNEVKWKTNVQFDWETDTSLPGGLTYAIEYHEKNKRQPTINRIERRVKGHATN